MIRPLLRFLSLGALLLVGRRALAPEPHPTLVLPATRVEALRADWRAREGRPPSPGELSSLVRGAIDEEILVHEALARGLDRGDAVVARRLLRNLRFLDEADGGGARARLERAHALAMPEHDLVVRRRLVHRLEARLAETVPEPDEAALATWVADHPERFTAPARVRLSHVFLAGDPTDPERIRAASALREALVREGTPPETAPRRGDAFPGGHHLPLASQAELARLFGPGFSERVLALAPGTWSEPLPSIHGLHLVFAHERRDAEPLPLARVHARARAELLEEHVATNLAAELARLRTRYAVRVEGAVPVAAGAGS